MNATTRLQMLATGGRVYASPLRQLVRSYWGAPGKFRLGPTSHSRRRVVLRSPELNDFETWRTIRLRDQHLIEPFWGSSPLTWADRHTEKAWAREVFRARRTTRSGLALPLVVEVDGQLAGQFNLESIDRGANAAELGVWMDSSLRSAGVLRSIRDLFCEHAFGPMELRRITAPICVDNRRAEFGAKSLGMRCEGTMTSYFDVGGQRKNHNLWAMTSEMWEDIN